MIRCPDFKADFVAVVIFFRVIVKGDYLQIIPAVVMLVFAVKSLKTIIKVGSKGSDAALPWRVGSDKGDFK